jgi:hypothetical protein
MEEEREPGRELEEQSEDRLDMTPEQWEQFQAFTRGFGEQSESGVDISLLRANLKLTPTERLRKMFRRSAVLAGGRNIGTR